LLNPVTQQKIHDVKKGNTSAHEDLLGRCAVSSDPEVRASLERYNSTVKLLEIFGIRKVKHE
jgi:hypothetical protein